MYRTDHVAADWCCTALMRRPSRCRTIWSGRNPSPLATACMMRFISSWNSFRSTFPFRSRSNCLNIESPMRLTSLSSSLIFRSWSSTRSLFNSFDSSLYERSPSPSVSSSSKTSLTDALKASSSSKNFTIVAPSMISMLIFANQSKNLNQYWSLWTGNCSGLYIYKGLLD